jgi:hypothetical protein
VKASFPYLCKDPILPFKINAVVSLEMIGSLHSFSRDFLPNTQLESPICLSGIFSNKISGPWKEQLFQPEAHKVSFP